MKKWSADDYWFELTEGRSPDGVGFVRYHEITCRKCNAKSKVRNTGQSVAQMYKIFQRQKWDIGKTRFQHHCPDCAQKHKHPTPEHPPKPSNVVQLRPLAASEQSSLQMQWDRANESERADFLLMLETTQGLILARAARAPTPTPSADPPKTTVYRVTRPGLTDLDQNEIITTRELLAAQEKYGSEGFDVRAVDTAKIVEKKSVDEFLREVKERSKTPPADDGWQRGAHIDSMPIEQPQPPIEHPVAVSSPDVSDTTNTDDDDDDVADWWKELHSKD